MTVALVLKTFSVDPNAANGYFIEIRARRPGFSALVMSMFRIDPITELTCNGERIQVRTGSLLGASTTTVPLTAVTAIEGGYTKPLELLAVAAACGVGALAAFAKRFAEPRSEFAQYGMAVALLCLFTALCFVVAYALKKQMRFFFQNGGDKQYGLAFSRGAIEGVPVDIARVDEAVALLNALVLQAATRTPLELQRAA